MSSPSEPLGKVGSDALTYPTVISTFANVA